MTSSAFPTPVSPAPLILVVGPSGAGKDTLIEGARRAFAGDPTLHIARRVVTRQAQPGAEDHDVLSPDDFFTAERAGAFLLSWHAHGLSYGIPTDLQKLRTGGVTVIANVSRLVIDEARRRLAPVRVVLVTAPPERLAERLAARGRESAGEILGRLKRARDDVPSGPDTVTVLNDRSADEGILAFVAAIRANRDADDAAALRRLVAE